MSLSVYRFSDIKAAFARLRPNPLAAWELRIGRLRVFYEVPSDELDQVHILAIGWKDGHRLFIDGEGDPPNSKFIAILEQSRQEFANNQRFSLEDVKRQLVTEHKKQTTKNGKNHHE